MLLGGLGSSFATDLDTIGLTALLAREPALTGNQVIVAQVEASVATPNFVYQANPAYTALLSSQFTYFETATPYPAGSSFSGVAESWHANNVVAHLCGASGVAPGLLAVKGFEANYFVNSLIGASVNMDAHVVNQSFVFASQDTNIDLYYDRYADSYKILFVNGVNNGNTTTPPSPATMYNGIAVGLMDGGGSTGPTPLDGRSKPDMVAPSSATSYATPYVAGAAALLIQAGNREDGGVGTASAATDPRTLKAFLLNGATKPSGWVRQGSEPLDRNLGAGILNMDISHQLLSGGKHAPTVSGNYTSGAAHLPPTGISGNVTSLTGWNFRTIQNFRIVTYKDAVDHYFFDLPASQSGAFNGTCTLVWNRQAWQADINNLDLFLYNANTNELVASSTSGVDNVEHIYFPNLPAGRYTLQVYKPSAGVITYTENYALAFQFSPVPLPSTPTNCVATPVSDSQNSLAWTDTASAETGFRILRSTVADSGFVEIGTSSANVTSFTDATVTPRTLYYYRVIAYSLAGDSAPATASCTSLSHLESWRKTYFLTTVSDGVAADANDADGDGLTNLVEYVIGSNPILIEPAVTAPLSSIETIGQDSYLTLTLTRAQILADVTLAAEVSEDLLVWTSDVTVLENTATSFIARDNVSLSSASKRFIRIKVTVP